MRAFALLLAFAGVAVGGQADGRLGQRARGNRFVAHVSHNLSRDASMPGEICRTAVRAHTWPRCDCARDRQDQWRLIAKFAKGIARLPKIGLGRSTDARQRVPNGMDKQAVFDRVVALIHAQGGPGCQHNGCFYRTGDGRKSAIGCLIPDEIYSDALEDCDPSNLPRYVLDEMDAESADEIGFLAALEASHDSTARSSRDAGNDFWSEWTTALERIARDHSLSLTTLHALEPPAVPDEITRPPIKLARLGRPPLIWRNR